MANRYFYYIKLKEEFFDTPEEKVLESLPNGYSFVVFYEKLMVEARNHGGYLRLNPTTPYTVETLCPVIHFPTDLGKAANKVLESLGLVEWIAEGDHKGDLFIPAVSECVGAESADAAKVSKCRGGAGKKGGENSSDGSGTIIAAPEQCNHSVTTALPQCNHSETSPSRPSPTQRPETREQSLNDSEKDGFVTKREKGAPLDPAKEEGEFEAKYPRRSDCSQAKAWFLANRPGPREFGAIMFALGRFASSEDWRKQGGRYVPLPERWLASRPWTELDAKMAEQAAYERELNAEAEKRRSELEKGPAAPAAVEMPKARQMAEAKI